MGCEVLIGWDAHQGWDWAGRGNEEKRNRDHLISKKKHICRDRRAIEIKKKASRISVGVGVQEIFQGVGKWIGVEVMIGGAHVGCFETVWGQC